MPLFGKKTPPVRPSFPVIVLRHGDYHDETLTETGRHQATQAARQIGDRFKARFLVVTTGDPRGARVDPITRVEQTAKMIKGELGDRASLARFPINPDRQLLEQLHDLWSSSPDCVVVLVTQAPYYMGLLRLEHAPHAEPFYGVVKVGREGLFIDTDG